MTKQIGIITVKIRQILALPYDAGTKILIGPYNIQHMQAQHPNDYSNYGQDIAVIINTPDYVGFRNDGTIEYIKEYTKQQIFVKIAVRPSSNKILFVRSLYVITTNKIKRFIAKGDLKHY